jgi:hypothetical protein
MDKKETGGDGIWRKQKQYVQCWAQILESLNIWLLDADTMVMMVILIIIIIVIQFNSLLVMCRVY